MRVKTGYIDLLPLAAPALLPLHAFVLALFAIGTVDIWMILVTGELIVAGGDVVRRNVFSFSFPDTPWIEHKWLFDVAAWLLYRRGGPGVLIVLKAAATAAIVVLVLARCRLRRVRPFAAVAVLLAALWLMRARLEVRPHLLSDLFCAIFLLALDAWERRGRHRVLLVLPLVQALWVNVHGSFILGPLVTAAYLPGALLPGLRLAPPGAAPDAPPARRPARALLLALAAVVAACFLNPYGHEIFLSPLSHFFSRGISTSAMAEWLPLDYRAMLAGRDMLGAAFFLFFIAGTIAFIAPPVRRRPDAAGFLVHAAFLFLALRSQRFVLTLAVASLPVMESVIATLREAWTRRRRAGGAAPGEAQGKRARVAAAAAWALLALLVAGLTARDLAARDPDFPLELTIGTGDVPEGAADFMLRHGLEGNVLNSFDYGFYLSARLYPAVRTFIDGRIDLFSDAFLASYMHVFSNPRLVDFLHRKYDMGYILVLWGSPGTQKLVRHLAESGGAWGLVYFDGRFALWAHADEAEAAPLPRYTAIGPAVTLARLEERRGDEAFARRALDEARRLVAEDPRNAMGHFLAGFIRERLLGEEPPGCPDYRKAAAGDPRSSSAALYLGACLGNAGDAGGALAAYEALLRLAPGNVEALLGAGLSRMKLGDGAGARASWEEALRVDPGNARAAHYLALLGKGAGKTAGGAP